MTIEKAIFYGFGAWVGRIDGETRCGFWPKHPAEVNFDPILLIPVDLSKTPTAAKKGKIDWDEIQVDDFKDGTPSGGVTTIGPMFPDGATTGVVYLEKSYYERLRPEIRPPIKPQASPQDNCGNNRLTAVVYGEAAGNPRAGLRYHAFLARIVSERKTSALVAVRNLLPATSTDPPLEHSFDLASAECDAHLSSGGLTEIGIGPGKPKNGLLFVELGRARALGIEPLKAPIQCGMSFPPRPSRPRRTGFADPRTIVGPREFHLESKGR